MFRFRRQQEFNYEVLLRQEAARINYNEIIDLPPLAEEELCLASSAAHQALSGGRTRRRDLLDAGFAFVNVIGGGEKPLLAAEIPGSPSLDTSKRALLTHDELSRVLEFQRARPEIYGHTDTESTRADMLDFLLRAVRTVDTKKELFRRAQREIMNNAPEADRETFARWFAGKIALEETTGGHIWGIMQESTAQLDTRRLQGIPIDVYGGIRFNRIVGAPSPFVDSGFRFGTNYDVTLFPNDNNRTRRINMVNIHLLSRGLNEMGAGLSHDQTYMTAGEYTQLKENLEATPSEEIWQGQVTHAIAARLLTAAKESR